MRIAIVSHTPIDQIEYGTETKISVGGPTSYCGLTARELGFDVKLATKIGLDFPEDLKRSLGKSGLQIPSGCVSPKSPSTRFKLVLRDKGRDLFLLARCDDITAEDIKLDTDTCIVSPIINEVHRDLLPEVRKHTGFVFLDPQGFLRRVGSDGRCYIARTEMNLGRAGINAIKVDEEEARALTGSIGIDAIKKLRVGIAILTGGNKTIMLHNERLYEISTEASRPSDSTGLGDIFAAAYTCAFAKEDDAVWALCTAVATSLAALKSNAMGISKIPARSDVEAGASLVRDGVKILHV